MKEQRLFVLWVIFLALAPPVDAYASWLKCYVDLDDTEVVMNYKVRTHEDATHKVGIEVRKEGTEEWTTNFFYPKNEVTTVQARLKVPSPLEKQTVQYVMETTPGAQFVDPPMCEGRRSFARNHDDHVTLEIQGTSDSLELWAGWASGFDVVSLTNRLVLRQEGAAEEL
jgi:hypothetical protein